MRRRATTPDAASHAMCPDHLIQTGLRRVDHFESALGILRRRCADHIRGAQTARSHRGELDQEPEAKNGMEESLAIRQAFAALPPDQRLAAQLFFVEGLTLAEIAEVQQVPVGTAKSRLFHARRQLKAALSGDVT